MTVSRFVIQNRIGIWLVVGGAYRAFRDPNDRDGELGKQVGDSQRPALTIPPVFG
jgi:hypothetical protein